MSSSIFFRWLPTNPRRKADLNRLRSALSFPPRRAPDPIRPDPRWLPLLVSAAMAALIVLQATMALAPEPSSPGALPAARPVAAPSLSPAPADWTHILDRPLFSPDRRPAPTVETGTSWDGVLVTGIAVAGDSASALVRGPTGKSIRLRPGQIVEGWTVRSIDPQHIILDRAGESLSLGFDPKRLRSSAKGKETFKGTP